MRARRALSTVVGMVFAIIAITSTVVYVTYSMNILNNFGQSVLQQTQQTLNTGNEKFQITSVTTPGNKFNVTVVNTGNLPINFTKIWVQNTTATDWIYSYVPSKAFVNPGGIVTNIGQSIPLYYKPTASYNVKLVTSRGNSQGFTVNSASAAPLNIQLLALPPTLPSGFKTELVMIVTNNGSSTLVNVTPNTPSNSNSVVCTLGQVSPAIYNTLTPGSTAVFKWDVTAIGQQGGSTCTFSFGSTLPPLQNGHSQTLQTTITVTTVNLFTDTTYAQSAGILVLNYSSFRWAETGQGNTWNQGWTWPHGSTTAFKLNMTNNNSTQTVNFYISKSSMLLFYSVHISPSEQPVAFYIVNSTNPATMASTAYSNCNGQSDYCLSVPPKGTVTLYFASTTPGCGTCTQSFGNADIYTAFLLMFGKFTSSQTSNGPLYAQNIPYIAADVS